MIAFFNRISLAPPWNWKATVECGVGNRSIRATGEITRRLDVEVAECFHHSRLKSGVTHILVAELMAPLESRGGRNVAHILELGRSALQRKSDWCRDVPAAGRRRRSRSDMPHAGAGRGVRWCFRDQYCTSVLVIEGCFVADRSRRVLR